MGHRTGHALRIALVSGAIAVGTDAIGAPEAQVRVQGASRIEANSTVSAQGTQVAGVISDDAGRTVSRAHIRVRLLGDAGNRPSPAPQTCGASMLPRGAKLSESGNEVVAETDGNGRFCLRWPVPLGDGRVAVEFEDDRSLLDPSSIVVDLNTKAPLDLAFAPPPRSISAEDPLVTVVLQAQGAAAIAQQRTPVTLSWSRNGGPTIPLTHGELRAGEALRLSFPPRSLGAPGTGALVASAEMDGHKEETRAPVTLTGRVQLDSPAQVTADSDGDTRLLVGVESAFGRVSSGSVEAVANGRTVGIAKVHGGRAEVAVSLAAEPATVAVSLRYLPDAPWWTPDSERQTLVVVPRASPMRRLPWAIGLLAVAAWVLAAWRRPSRQAQPQAKPSLPHPMQPALEWSFPDVLANGWTGQVIDAHDGSPVAAARISILWPSGDSAHANANSRGEFEILADHPDKHAALIRIEARFHSSLERPLPPPGKLSVALITRRRALVSRLVDWAARRGPPYAGEKEPTPGDVIQAARRGDRPDVALWAASLERAAFGPTPVDEQREAEVQAAEPSTARGS